MDPQEKNDFIVLKAIYNDEKLISYLTSQLLQIYYSSLKIYGQYLGILIALPSQTEEYSHSVDHHQIQFIILLGKGFPRTAPRLYLKSILGHPSFNDQRDFLQSVLGQWEGTMQLKQIVDKIPSFLKQFPKGQDIKENIRIGKRELNTVLCIQFMKEVWGDQMFYGFEKDEQKLVMYIFTVSETHFCMFLSQKQPYYEEGKLIIPPENKIQLCSLVFWAQIGSLIQMVINREDPTDVKLVFKAKKTINMEIVDHPTEKHLRVRKGGQFCQKLLKNIKNFNILQMKLDMHLEGMDLEEQKLVKEVQECEKVLKHHLNQETIKQMNGCYQKVIEYYSSRNIPHYHIFLDKITKLYQRPDVRVIMSQNQ